jgi:uncharacterized protein YegP (UPF0339 family)
MSAPLHIEKFSVPRRGAIKPRYYFRVVAANSEIIAQSESYNTPQARNKTAKLLAESKIEVGK